MAHMRRDTDRRERSRGLMLIETALVFFLLVLLTFGVLEYGWMFMNAQHVTNAARQGARVGVRVDSINADVTAEVDAVLTAQGITNYTVNLDPTSVETPSPGDPLTVTVTVPYADIALTGMPFIPVPTNLQSAVTMSKEGP